MTGVRMDIWLWAARFFKTRSLASDAVEKGRVRIGGANVKPSKDVRGRRLQTRTRRGISLVKGRSSCSERMRVGRALPAVRLPCLTPQNRRREALACKLRSVADIYANSECFNSDSRCYSFKQAHAGDSGSPVT